MKRSITSVPQIYRNIRRWTEIASVLSKYGLAHLLSRFNVDFLVDLLKAPEGEIQSQLTQSARIRLALTELGSTFIKFGQLLSTRPDIIGAELADELSKLQSNAPADDFETVKQIIETEQDQTIDELFSEFDPEPMASASIGQVHLARINNEEVVVKVRHSGIERLIETDLDILSGLAQLSERMDDLRHYQPVATVNEISKIMRQELDFNRERRTLTQFRSMFANDSTIIIPQPVASHSNSRMLTMQRVVGVSLHEARESNSAAYDLPEIARQGANLYLEMIFEYGYYHADPHPGNILITSDGTIGLLDFGMVGRISERLREDIEGMLVAIANQDVLMLTTLVKRVGNCPHDLNESELSNEVADFVGQYSTQELSQFDMSGALNDFISLVRRFDITLPSEASLLIKVLVSLEGTGRLLNPDFSLMEIMKPFQRKLLLKRLSPARQLRKMRRFYLEAEQLMDDLPRRISSILEQIQSGRFDVHLDHRRLGPTANRLVMGLMTSALFLGSSLMLSYKVPPLFFPGSGPWGIQDLSFLGMAGLLGSFLMGLRLMWAVRKSGNLDQQE